MTIQRKEGIIYKGKMSFTNDYPLDDFITTLKDNIKKERENNPVKAYKRKSDNAGVFLSSDCRRGYVGSWEIKDDKLYLIKLEDFPKNDRPYGMDALFPGQTKVFADWFTGDIRIPQGEILFSIFYAKDIYEEDHILSFKDGYLVDAKIVDNYEYAAELSEERKRINEAPPVKPSKPLKGFRKMLQNWIIKRRLSNLRKSS